MIPHYLINKNRPATIVLSLTQVREIAAKAGLKVREKTEYMDRPFTNVLVGTKTRFPGLKSHSSFNFYSYGYSNSPKLTIKWREEVSIGKIKYIPIIVNDLFVVEKTFFQAAGITCVEVEIPEQSIFSFDAETNGLYGSVWAIGALVIDHLGKIIDQFSGQLDSSVVTNQWALDNVVPNVDLERFDSAHELRDSFWAFWMKHRENTVCIADVGSPVETGLFRACVEDDLSNREWLGPYPLHEVATALYDAGIDPNIDRIQFSGLIDLKKHDPLDDSRASAICWLKAQEILHK